MFVFSSFVPVTLIFLFCLFIPDEEKNLVEEVFNNAIDALSDEDKKLPQVFTLHIN